MRLFSHFTLVAAALVAQWLVATSLLAQTGQPPKGFSPLNFPNQFAPGSFAPQAAASREYSLAAKYEVQKDSRDGRLSVTMVLGEHWHVYATTQVGGPGPAKIQVTLSSDFEVVGPFSPDRDPQERIVRFDDGKPIWDEPVQEFYGQVTWTAPIHLSPNADPEKLSPEIKFTGQVCVDGGSCLPLSEKVKVDFGGYYEPVTPTGQYRAPISHVTWSGHLEPAVTVPGGTARVVLTATPDTNWHIYAFGNHLPKSGPKPTSIVWKKKSGLMPSPVVASAEPVVENKGGADGVERYHAEPVTWTMDIPIPSDWKQGEYDLSGLIGYMTCSTACDPPTAAQFDVAVVVGAAEQAGQRPLAFGPAKYQEVETVIKSLPAEVASRDSAAAPLNVQLLLITILGCFVGGLVLNLMPCVLPVIGLKVLSFAEQAKQHQSSILTLNITYALGMLSVFMVLAALAAFLNFGWGEQFTLTWFKVTLTGLVFVMALSFLGVWEIPIPGFAGAGKSQELQAREGLSGAYFKGVFTTVLATPCSGPFLGSAFGFTLGQPVFVTFLIFGSVGLGMASPYLIIGVYPGLLRFLPKPGAWMETFKQFMAFLLLGTVVYLFSTLKSDYFIPTLALIMGLWLACWWIGRLPITADTQQKIRRWVTGTATATLVGVFAFTMLVPSKSTLDWQPFSPQALASARADGKTVLVDFTADWCLNCQWNLKTAINRQRVYSKVEENDVVTLVADWSDRDEVIKQQLLKLNSKSIPVLAVYPAGGTDDDVIVLRDIVTEGQVLNALEQAGPSLPKASAIGTAMND